MQLYFSANHGLPQLAANIQALEDKLGGDLTPLMDAIGLLLENSTRERFETKRDPEGISWAQLKPQTIERKRNKTAASVAASWWITATCANPSPTLPTRKA